ncbi:hypothetical protein EMPG_15594 [Blastomyces silverae]|uniref:Zn(2)-C6 fungal-type domain-containing protein n=1 Tax=Blastomyces silverae TaxID=2060906 RepID=A0A0H1BII2_9EURO|nr:hypothetical protein EMPG_15594 [Blastomyces silverae]
MDRESNRQLRSACDRCHSQKLRCERQEGDRSCLRCSRTDALCVYSVRQRRTVLRPPRSKRRRTRDGVEGEDGSRGLNISSQLENPFGSAVVVEDNSTYPAAFDPTFGEWPEILQLPQDISVPGCDQLSLPDFSNSFVEPILPIPRYTGQTLTDRNQGIPGTLEDRPSMTIRHVRKLADLNVKLCEHAAKMPPVSANISEIQISVASRIFEIDEIFGLIQTLLDVTSDIYSHSIPPSETRPPAEGILPAPSSSSLLSPSSQKDQPSADRRPSAGTSPDSYVPDRATFLLILSCYDRGMDICQCLFTHIECCIKTLATPMSPEAQATQLPELRIGSYKPPISSAVAMKMFLFHTMARQLLVQLQIVLGVHESKTTTTTTTTGAGREGRERERDMNVRRDGGNGYCNGNETWPLGDDSYQNRNADIPQGHHHYTNAEATPPTDPVDKSCYDILTRAYGMSEQVTSIGKLLMDMSLMP